MEHRVGCRGSGRGRFEGSPHPCGLRRGRVVRTGHAPTGETALYAAARGGSNKSLNPTGCQRGSLASLVWSGAGGLVRFVRPHHQNHVQHSENNRCVCFFPAFCRIFDFIDSIGCREKRSTLKGDSWIRRLDQRQLHLGYVDDYFDRKCLMFSNSCIRYMLWHS